jgi:nickel transport protein
VNLKLKYFIILFFFLSYSNLTFAHRINVFAWVEGKTINVESKFAGGKAVKNGKISIADSSGKLVFSGITNEKGNISFKIQEALDYYITVSAGEGHKGTWKVLAHEISGPQPKKKQSPSPTYEQPDASTEGIHCISEEQFKRILDEKLKSVHGQLKTIRQNDDNKVKDIISGIGFILGIFGIFVLIKSRKSQE